MDGGSTGGDNRAPGRPKGAPVPRVVPGPPRRGRGVRGDDDVAAPLEEGPPAGEDPAPAQRGTHTVWTGAAAQEVPTYERSELRPGMRVTGYAIVEQYDATTVVLPAHEATVDPWLNLLIRPEGAQR